MKNIFLSIFMLLSLLFSSHVLADCAVTGATPETGEIVECTGSDTDGYDGTAFRDTLTIFDGATVEDPSEVLEMGDGNDEITILAGSTVLSGEDCIEGDNGDDFILMSGGTLACDSDGIRGSSDDDSITMTGGAMTVVNDGIEGDSGNDMITLDGGSITVTEIGIGNNGIEADDGNDTIFLISGSITQQVDSDQAVDAGSGDDIVTISGDVAIFGTINGGLNTDTLVFAQSVPAAELPAIAAELLAADPQSGSITINGETYVWLNFESINGQVNAAAAGGGASYPIPVDSRWALLLLMLAMVGFGATRLRLSEH